jgi:hypothetical protein
MYALFRSFSFNKRSKRSRTDLCFSRFSQPSSPPRFYRALFSRRDRVCASLSPLFHPILHRADASFTTALHPPSRQRQICRPSQRCLPSLRIRHLLDRQVVHRDNLYADDVFDCRVGGESKAAVHAKYGVSTETGGIVVVRPDGYVGAQVPLNADGFEAFERVFWRVHVVATAREALSEGRRSFVLLFSSFSLGSSASLSSQQCHVLNRSLPHFSVGPSRGTKGNAQGEEGEKV